VIPAERMKGHTEHRVPLWDVVPTILEKQKVIRINDYLFAGRGTGHASIHTLDRVLKRPDRNDVAVHGFRSAFRDWCAEQTTFRSEVAENVAGTHGRRHGDAQHAYRSVREVAGAGGGVGDLLRYKGLGGEVVASPVERQSAQLSG